VTIYMWHSAARVPFVTITAAFAYTTVVNVIERPEGIRIASFFIILTIVTSLVSRAMRSTELRIHNVTFDEEALRIIAGDRDRIIRVVAHRPGLNDIAEYEAKDESTRDLHHLTSDEQLIFLEIEPGAASDFTGDIEVKGLLVGRHNVLRT